MTDHPAEHDLASHDYIRAGYEYLFALPPPLFKAVMIAEMKNHNDFASGQISKSQYYHWKSLSWFTKEAIAAREIGWPDRG